MKKNRLITIICCAALFVLFVLCGCSCVSKRSKLDMLNAAAEEVGVPWATSHGLIVSTKDYESVFYGWTSVNMATNTLSHFFFDSIKNVNDDGTEDVIYFDEAIELAAWDAVYPGDDKIVRQTETVVFNGTESWNFGMLSGGMSCYRVLPGLGTGRLDVYCNYYSTAEMERNTVSLSGSFDNVIFRADGFSSVEEWKAYLSSLYAQGNPLTIVYRSQVVVEEYFNFNVEQLLGFNQGIEEGYQSGYDDGYGEGVDDVLYSQEYGVFYNSTYSLDVSYKVSSKLFVDSVENIACPLSSSTLVLGDVLEPWLDFFDGGLAIFVDAKLRVNFATPFFYKNNLFEFWSEEMDSLPSFTIIDTNDRRYEAYLAWLVVDDTEYCYIKVKEHYGTAVIDSIIVKALELGFGSIDLMYYPCLAYMPSLAEDVDFYGKGYNAGYAAAFDKQAESGSLADGIRSFLYSLFDAPVDTFMSVVNFEIDGFDLGGLVAFILTLFILAFIIKMFI